MCEREREGERGATESPSQQDAGYCGMACACLCVCVHGLNEFGELSALYDSCNWPEDSCYYTLQQGNSTCSGSLSASVCEREREREFSEARTNKETSLLWSRL